MLFWRKISLKNGISQNYGPSLALLDYQDWNAKNSIDKLEPTNSVPRETFRLRLRWKKSSLIYGEVWVWQSSYFKTNGSLEFLICQEPDSREKMIYRPFRASKVENCQLCCLVLSDNQDSEPKKKSMSVQSNSNPGVKSCRLSHRWKKKVIDSGHQRKSTVLVVFDKISQFGSQWTAYCSRWISRKVCFFHWINSVSEKKLMANAEKIPLFADFMNFEPKRKGNETVSDDG